MSSRSAAPAPKGSAFFRVGATATVAAALTLGSLGGGGLVASADVICSSDSCDGFQWQTARGVGNSTSYWGMSPGHNCTNYVAWKLIGNGVARPRTSPGDAATWASRAADDGYLVDTTATVGAVAQWNSFEGGNGVDGHVAYVEQVNADGTILLSEDYWHGGDQQGPLTFRTVDVSSVPRFIHYNDISHTIRQVSATSSVWSQQSTGLTAYPTAITAANMGGTTPSIVYSEDGVLYSASVDATGWHATSTGISSVSRTLSAVDMGGQSPQVMSLEGNVLYLNVQSGSGWQKMSTGVKITGDIAAVNDGGLLPTVFVSQGGKLFRVWGDADGWHAENTSVAIQGAITAVQNALGEPEVFSVENGTIHRTWRDAAGWHSENTGVLASGTITAVTAGGATQVILAQDDKLFTVSQIAGSWQAAPTGVVAGTLFAAVDMGGQSPLLLQVGGRSSLATPTAALFAPTAPPAGSGSTGATDVPTPEPTELAPTIDPTPTVDPTVDPTPTPDPVPNPTSTSTPDPTAVP